MIHPSRPEELEAALDLHARIRTTRAHLAEADAELALLLQQCWATGAHVLLGCATPTQYCHAIDISPEKARCLVRIANRLDDVPELHQGLRDGLGWTKLREIERVIVPETAAAWLTYCREHNQRDVASAARRSDRGELPPGPNEVRNPVRQRVVFEMDAAHAELLSRALEAERMRAGVSPDDFDAGTTLASWARRSLDHDSEDGQQVPSCGHQTLVTYCPGCRAVEGVQLELDAAAKSAALEDCQIVDLEQTETSARAVDELMGRPSADPLPSGNIRHQIPPSTRIRHFLRDRFVCRAPGCTCSFYLQLHHIKPVSEGGSNSSWNLLLLCSTHHRLHHRGLLGIEGNGDDVVTFTFADGRVLQSRPPDPPA